MLYVIQLILYRIKPRADGRLGARWPLDYQPDVRTGGVALDTPAWLTIHL